jgi:hypothetical protein
MLVVRSRRLIVDWLGSAKSSSSRGQLHGRVAQLTGRSCSAAQTYTATITASPTRTRLGRGARRAAARSIRYNAIHSSRSTLPPGLITGQCGRELLVALGLRTMAHYVPSGEG